MMKRILFLSVAVASMSSMAQTADCHENLLGGRGDSASYRLSTAEFDAGRNEDLNNSSAVTAAKKLLQRAECGAEKAQITSTCSEIKKGSNRTACLVEVQGLAGFFTIVKDYVDTFHIIYSRWD